MTATSLGTKGFSGLSFAILKDMGWYTVDGSFPELTSFGKNRGCSFLTDACYGSTSFPEFCDATAGAGISKCDTSFQGKADCKNIAGLMADGCGIYGQYFDCVDPASVDTTPYQSYTFDVYGTDSFCIESNTGSVAVPSVYQSRCYPFVCNSNSITFTIGTFSVTCLSS